MVRTIKGLLEFSGRNKSSLIQSFVYRVILTICEVIPILAIVYSLNSMILAKENGNQITIKTLIGAFLILLVGVIGKIIFGSIANSKAQVACFKMCADKRIEIGDRLKRIPMGYFSSNRLGEIASAVTTTIGDIETQAGHILNNLVVGVVHAVVIAIVISFFDWRIGLISIGAILTGLFVNSLLQKKSIAVSPKRQEAQSGLVAAVLEYIQGIAVVKAFNLGEKSNRAVDDAIEESRRCNIGLEKAFIKLIALYLFVFKVASGAMLMMACYLFSGGEFSLSNTLMIIVSSFVIFSQIEAAGNSSSLLRMMDSSMDKVNTLEQIPLMDENGMDIKPDNYDIEFKNVSFSYDSRKIFDNISLSIPQNTTAAFVGPSGEGKSTICNLIARFWDVNEGEVRLGGYNVKEYTCESLLNNISMVFQNVYLFQDTILNNIKFGRPKATMEEVVAAAKKACCHEFISNLPDGYSTMIGEGGCSLSGGEKQRISIARAILKDAPIIILDEATSSVDPENEKQLRLAIEELTRYKTVIMIAHRLSTVKDADHIFVLSGGHIVQQGKHEKLMNEEGIYSEFIQARRKAVGWSL
ncbi:Xenobiotic-transporting ATPase [Syntrophobotulus glycolicus DSM 8271]|uniref:Xenobiotic-transporting ATPase n=1 Tax=Syntrophobotulus glycolicus (strain DSM 8271 / FlGlyR) TaxID=645991 RepID=F0T2L8_SYNGF|nr:ABC transporter ATP-binding protein [Syntrophobotulus glycolicus]ADY56417.1 Xenobiotic-transporting ATPase [Syntrophobotulus glycolicus DSM 8271]